MKVPTENGIRNTVDAPPAGHYRLDDGTEVPVTEVPLQLQRLLRSHNFRNSRRYPRLLEFIVEQTLAGHPEVLKERTLGVAVFGRPGDYDSNADPVVRITAGEVRKRLAQYYQEPGHAAELRIELELGSYVAHFLPAHGTQPPQAAGSSKSLAQPTLDRSAEAQPRPLSLSNPEGGAGEPLPSVPAASISSRSEPQPLTGAGQPRPVRRHALVRAGAVSTLAVLLVLAGWAGSRILRPLTSPSLVRSPFWQPLVGGSEPVEVVMGVHTLDRQGNDLAGSGEHRDGDMLAAMLRTDMVPLSDIVAMTQLTDLLTASGQPYRVLSAEHASLREVRAAPVLLVGGLNNAWTLRLTAPLRYHFFRRDWSTSYIVDRDDPTKTWAFDNAQSVAGASTDYALVASFDDPTIGRPVVMVAGIGMAGTLAGAELVALPYGFGHRFASQ